MTSVLFVKNLLCRRLCVQLQNNLFETGLGGSQSVLFLRARLSKKTFLRLHSTLLAYLSFSLTVFDAVPGRASFLMDFIESVILCLLVLSSSL